MPETQTIQFGAPSTWPALNVRLFYEETDVEVVGTSATAASKGSGNGSQWSVDFDDIPAGRYLVVWFNTTGEINPQGDDFVTLKLITDVYPVESRIAHVEPPSTGPRAITVTVDDGTDVLQAVDVLLIEGANRHVGATDVDGVCLLGVSASDLTYDVILAKDGYTFAVTTLSVTGDTAITYSMTAIASPEVSNPGMSTGYVTCYDELGAKEEGVSVFVTITAGPGAAGRSFDTKVREVVTDSNGYAEFPNMIQGSSFEYWRTKTGKRFEGTVPIEPTFAFPESLGTYAVQ